MADNGARRDCSDTKIGPTRARRSPAVQITRRTRSGKRGTALAFCVQSSRSGVGIDASSVGVAMYRRREDRKRRALRLAAANAGANVRAGRGRFRCWRRGSRAQRTPVIVIVVIF